MRGTRMAGIANSFSEFQKTSDIKYGDAYLYLYLFNLSKYS